MDLADAPRAMDNPWPMADRPRPTGHRPTSFPWRLGAEELVSRVFPAIQRRPPVTRDAPDHPADTKRMALTSRQACRAGCAQRKAVEFQERLYFLLQRASHPTVRLSMTEDPVEATRSMAAWAWPRLRQSFAVPCDHRNHVQPDGSLRARLPSATRHPCRHVQPGWVNLDASLRLQARSKLLQTSDEISRRMEASSGSPRAPKDDFPAAGAALTQREATEGTCGARCVLQLRFPLSFPRQALLDPVS